MIAVQLFSRVSKLVLIPLPHFSRTNPILVNSQSHTQLPPTPHPQLPPIPHPQLPPTSHTSSDHKNNLISALPILDSFAASLLQSWWLLTHQSQHQSHIANSNIAVGDDVLTMAVSQSASDTWSSLQLQISPFTSVVTIDGNIIFVSTAVDRQWIACQYM